MNSNIFNYIVTIHNKGDILEKVLMSILENVRENSYVYPILDGCTDKSEEIVDRLISEHPTIFIKKIKLGDVHEILSINEGLKASNQSLDGYNIILQDDIVLLEDDLESKIIRLYQEMGPKLAYVSFRLGANLRKDFLTNPNSILFRDFIENAYGHGIDHTSVLLPGQFAYRSIGIKSPVCIPTRIIRNFGLLDEHLAPCFHDDTEYCLRLLKNGYQNGVFAVKYESDLDWGGTRQNPNPRYADYIKKNVAYLKEKYRQEISQIISSPQDSQKHILKEYYDISENKKALNQYHLNRKKTRRFERKNLNALGILRSYLSKIIFK